MATTASYSAEIADESYPERFWREVLPCSKHAGSDTSRAEEHHHDEAQRRVIAAFAGEKRLNCFKCRADKEQRKQQDIILFAHTHMSAARPSLAEIYPSV